MSTLNYQISGNGTPVILIHGLFGNLDNLRTLANALTDHQVIRVDVPNHGLSPHWQKMDYPSLAQAMTQLLDELSIDSAHFMGHSMGGKIAMAAALLNPQYVKSLVIADIAPVSYNPRHQLVFAALNQLDLKNLRSRSQALTELLNSGIDEGTAQFLLKNLQNDDAGFSWKMNLAGLQACYDKLIGWDLSDDNLPANELPSNKISTELSYTGPSLCIRGGDSDYVKAEHSAQFLQQFPAIQAKTLAGTGHWLHAQKPAIFNRLVSDFIASND
ncbi:alpha/beta fold hydrolase [Shewanella psychrotolerans]|uniref:alpha/beta fold hydrolase n=1 Tax=Shewanella psychrotolerans TaxID=2864206 RepID=UPI001C66162C|nr:alpha/beta fold hydrolase [Shewanella psychrotolerans]QYJ99821.1 alpha/beta fold hydrolase [Shewanella psychrotolerans]